MKTSYLQKATLLMLFCLFCFSAKTSTAQLLPGDLAIIGVNAEPTVTTTPSATISFVALAKIPSGTAIHLTDIGYTGSAFVVAPVPPATTTPDGTANWNLTADVPAGTVFTVTIHSGVVPTVSILPNTYGPISLDASSWSHATAAPIPINAGDTWFLYSGTKASPNFIYGFTNAKNPALDEIDETTGWTKDGKTPKNQSSTLPTALKNAGTYTSLNSFKTVDKQRDFNTYSGVFSGSKSSLLDMIKNPGSWTATSNPTDVKDLTPGNPGSAFPGTQPIYKLPTSVLSITSSPSTGTKILNDVILITVNFSDNVIVGGKPLIKLNSGANAYAQYTSGSIGKALVFTYKVSAGEDSQDLDYSDISSLLLDGGSIADQQSQNALLALPAPGTAESLGGSSSLRIDALNPTISTVTAITANGSYLAGQTIDIQVNFSEPVFVTGTPVLSLNSSGSATYVSGTGTNALKFTYTIVQGHNALDLDYSSTTALTLADGTIKDAASNNAILSLPTPGTAGSLGNIANIIIDTTFPTVADVGGTSGSYIIGATPTITINFSENVTVTGTPSLALNVGSPAGNATYVSGSGTSILTFNYTVAPGQSSALLDYTSTTALSLAGGSIKDAAGNDAILTLASPGALGSLSNGKNIVINGIPPTVLSIARKAPTTVLTNSASVEYTVTFSEPVNGVDASDFIINIGSTPLSAITSIAGSGATYIATINTGIGNGVVSINLKASGTGITNLALNPIQTGFGPSESYTIDKLPPAINIATIQSNHTGNGAIAIPGDLITLNFTANEVIKTPTVTISGNPATVTNPAGNNWVATYTMLTTDSDGPIPFNISYADLAGNTPAPKTTTSNFSQVTYDKTVPTLISVIIRSNASFPGYAKTGSVVTLQFTGSESLSTPVVTIGGIPVTAILTGNNWSAQYSIPSTLAEGEIAFTINYKDLAGNIATTQTTVTSGTMVTVDRTAPTLSNVSISSNNANPALAKSGDVMSLTFTASEGIATPTVTLYGVTLATVTPQANNVWTATYTLGAATIEGPVTFQIGYSDFAGNAGIAVSTTNDGSSVTFDRTPPSIPNPFTVTAGNTQNTMAWPLNSDVAKYELIGGTPLTLSNDVLATVLAANATNTMAFTHGGLTNLTTYYYALRVTDAAGNTSQSSTVNGRPLNGQTITFNQPVAAEYGSTFTLNATSSTGLPVTFTSNDLSLATISGNTVTIVGANQSQSVSISANQLGNANYSAAPTVTRLLQIKPKPVTVTATAQAKVFGSPEPALNAPTLNPALIGSDASTGTLSRMVGENAGNYEIQQNTFNLDPYKYAITYEPADFTISKQPVTITPQLAYSKTYGQTDPTFAYNFTPLASPGVITGDLARAPGEDAGTYNFDLGTLTAGSNYDLSLSTLPQFTISKSEITVTPITASIEYGDTDPVIAYNYTPALQAGDSFTGALVRASGNAPGNYLITQGSLALSSNYTLNFSPTPVNFVVQKKNIGITPIVGQGKVYGDLDGTINYLASPTLLNGDTFSGALSRTVGSTVANYQILLGSLATTNSQNYNVQLNPENYSITKKAIQVTATAVSKVYGTSDPLSLPYTLSTPLVNGDSFSGNLARTPGADIGAYPINIGDLNLNSNYDLSFTAADLTITPKAIAITAVSNAKTYGDTDPVFAYTGTPALISGDNFTGLLGRVSGEDVGNYALTLGSLKLSDNYTLTLNPGTQLTINKKPILVTTAEKSKVYGSADPVLSYIPTPALVNGNGFNGALGRAPGENKGTYAITPGNLSAGSNYDLSFNLANLTIDAAPLTLTADPKSKFVGTENPVFTGQYSGFVNGENASVLTSPAVYTSVATIASPIGTYPIVPSGATALNYTIIPVNGVLTVKPGAPTSVALAAITLYENQAAGTPAGTLSSTSEDSNATFTYSLVGGSGDTDNASFRIVNDQLLTAASLDYENKKTYSVVVRSTTQHGFSLDKSFTINLSDVNEIPTLDAIANKTICYTTTGQTIDLTGISAGPETGQKTSITVTGSNAALLQSLTFSPSGSAKGTLSYRVKNGASGVSTITVTVKDDGGTNNGGVDTYSRTFVLTVNALPVVAISANTGENNNANSTSVSKGETVVLTATGGSTYVWALHNSIISGQNAGVLTVRPRETTTYTVTVSNANGCTEQKSFTVNVLDDMEKIKATNILSPNGDGYNDKWIVENIDFYPNNEVKIFDKSGRMVYSKKGYDNSWDGTLNGTPLTEGTYYYVIDFGKNLRKFKGFITIIREN